MAYHLCRDFKNPLAVDNWDWGATYVMALFLRRVLGYSYIGSTNFQINSIGNFLLATGDSTPTSNTPSFGGNTASIDGYYNVTIPAGIRVVSAADVGMVLVLKSPSNPTYNSGVFLITGYNVPGNYYTIDYRSSDASIVESGLLWYLYESAGTLKANSYMTRGTAGSGGYKGRGTSTNSRLILQSPHATGWQVRLCIETTSDWADNSNWCASQTHTVGDNGAGDGYGDWSIGDSQKAHCHVPLFFDVAGSNGTYASTGCGTYPWWATSSNGTIHRVTLAGDDTGQYCFSVYRTDLINNTANVKYLMSMVGICDNEPDPTVPTKNRMFQFGISWAVGAASGIDAIRLTNGIAQTGYVAGYCWGNSQIPIIASFAPWMHSWSTYPYSQANLADSPWIGATELLPIDLVGGANVYWPKTIYEPRVLGTIPCIKAGRTNFGNWSLTTDKSWQHLQNEIYMQWGGPTVMP